MRMIESGQAVVVTREVEMRQWADQVEKCARLLLVYGWCVKVPYRIHLYGRCKVYHVSCMEGMS